MHDPILAHTSANPLRRQLLLRAWLLIWRNFVNYPVQNVRMETVFLKFFL